MRFVKAFLQTNRKVTLKKIKKKQTKIINPKILKSEVKN